MNKADKILIGAILILFIGFLVNYNGNLITGKYSEDVGNEVTGDGIKDITGMAIKDVSGCGECPQECIDNNAECVNEGVSAECDAAFQSCYVPCMATRTNAYCVSKCNPKKIKYTCSYEEAPIEEKCTDSDGGINEYVYGEATDELGVKKDFCRTLGLKHADQKYYWLYEVYETGSCKVLDSLWSDAGYVSGCYVREAYCDGGVAKEKLKLGESCDLGVCYNGQCACDSDDDCGSGYECTDYNLDLDSNFCKKIVEPPVLPPAPTGCRAYDGDKVGCIGENTAETTVCVYTSGHCCGDGKMWDGINCIETAPEYLCYPPFWPGNKDNVDYTENKVCWNVGSWSYGFWVSVSTY